MDDGRGESAAKPFKTIVAAAQYVANNYNMGAYTATIHVAEGYDGYSTLRLPLYNATTGRICIKGESSDYAGVKVGTILLEYAVSYDIVNITARVMTISSGTVGAIQVTAGVLTLYNVCCDMKSANQSSGSGRIFCLYAATNGMIRIWATAADSYTPGVTFDIDGAEIQGILHTTTFGQIQFTADLTYKGAGSVVSANAYVTMVGVLLRSVSSLAVPGRLPVVVMEEGASVTGSRYQVQQNGILNTGGGGVDFLPGTTAGTTATGGQYA